MNYVKEPTKRVLTTILVICYFLILPYPFMRDKVYCTPISGTPYSDCESREEIQWSWLGGYRIAIDRFLPKEGGPELEMFISKYYGVTYGGLFGLGIVSLGLGVGTYFGGYRLLRRKKPWGFGEEGSEDKQL